VILLIAIVLVAGVALFGALMFVGSLSDRVLTSRVRNRMHPGEEVIYHSPAMWQSVSLPARIFTHQSGYVIVTDRRIFLASFSLFWPSVNETWLRDVDDVQQSAGLAWGWIKLTASGKTRMVTPTSNSLLDYPIDLPDKLVEAINQGRFAHA